jgi:hypothetical protein
MRGGSPEYARAFEGQIGENLGQAAEKLEAAVGALQGESAARRDERALEAARELVRGMESLRERTGESLGAMREQQSPQGAQGAQGTAGEQQGQQGQQGQGQQGQGQGQQGQGQQGEAQGQGQRGQQGGMAGQRDGQPGGGGGDDARPSGDTRQFAREFGLRRQNAESLRELARAQGVDVSELNRAIDDLRRLESGRPLGDPRGAAQLQSQVIDRLKAFEFGLYRELTATGNQKASLGARSPVPSEYRAQVEEYYRSLARPK